MSPKARSLIVLVLSHGMAMGAGWGIYKAFSKTGQPGHPDSPELSSSHPRTRSARVRERGGISGDPGQKLLDRLLDQADAARSLPDLTPSPNRATAARKALDAWAEAGCPTDGRKEVFVRFKHWLEVDPKGALAYWGGSGVGMLTKEESQIVEESLASVPLSKLSGWLRPPSELNSTAAVSPVVSTLGRLIAASGDPKLLEDALKNAPDQSRGRLVPEVIRQWPEGKLARLDAFIKNCTDVISLKAYLERLRPADRISWIRNAMEKQPELTQQIMTRVAEEAMYGAIGGAIDDRMAVLAKVAAETGKPPPSESLRTQLLARDVANWLQTSDASDDGNLSDWRHRMTQGKIGGQEVLESAKRALPALAASHPEALRTAVFETLAKIHPAAAMETLSDVPLAEKEKQVLKTATAIASSGDPRRVSELLSLRPATLASSPNDRFQVWMTASDPGVRNYGDSYENWVMSMPEGLDRDMALGALALRVEAADPQQAAKLRAAKTLPPGWRPGKS